MALSSTTGWIALALLPLCALMGILLRRIGHGPIVRRLRPHFIVGYVALAFTVLHLVLSSGAMGTANMTGIWFATLGLIGLGAQVFSGASLQSPGVYRRPLRRWHIALFWVVITLSVLHIVFNAPFIAFAIGSQ